MNNKLLFALGALAVAFCFTACYPDEPEQSTIATYKSFGLEGLQDQSVAEAHVTIPVEFVLNEDQIMDLTMPISVDPSSTATEGVDFILPSHEVSVLALSGGGSFDVEILDDFEAEGNETIVLNIGSSTRFGLPEGGGQTTVTIEDNRLLLTFDWTGESEYMYLDTVMVYDTVVNVIDTIINDTMRTITTTDITSRVEIQTISDVLQKCGPVDMDIYTFDMNGGDLGHYAATGNCPEFMVVDPNWGDGDYFMNSNMWGNPLDPLGLGGPLVGGPVEYPLTITVEKAGVFKTTFTPSDVWNSSEADAQHQGTYNFKPAINVNISGSTYRVTDPANGNLIAEG